MKKILIFVISLLFINYTYAESCNKYIQKYEENYDLWLNSSYTDNNRDDYYNSYIVNKESYDNCYTKFKNYFDKGYSAYEYGNYLEATEYYEKALQYINDEGAKNNLCLAYYKLAYGYYEKGDFNNSIIYYRKAEISGFKDKFTIYFNTGLAYYQLGDYLESKKYLNYALDNTFDEDEIKSVKERIILIDNDKKDKDFKNELIKNAPTNDTLSGFQYYLKQLNIPNAWKKITKNNQVIVAIIDDGININHPDLVNSIWINSKAKYGDSKIIDFVGDGLIDNLSTGDHGTMIAGIIGATINNNEGIAGIAKNVKLMPLRVFDVDGNAKEDNIIKAIDYAIENGANIINLSLGQSQFKYSTKYDEIIKKAFDNGIIVVIAAGNGDLLTGQETGVNLTNNPIAPVCNNGGKYQYSIGVYATNEEGYRTNWTNYGDCTNFFAPGVDIVSTSIPIYNSNYGTNYNMAGGTSFSAPIISGIIALGYNQYGYTHPNIVYSTLEESKVSFKLPDGQTGYKIDASKYIDILGKKVNLIKKGELIFKNLKTKLDKTTKYKREKTYRSLLSQLNRVKGKISGDKAVIINQLVVLINKELGN